MSIPALGGYHPNRFQPMPRKPGPSPCSLSAVPPPTPAPGAGPTLLQPDFGSQASHPCALAPAPSPSQRTCRLPLVTGAAGAFSPPPAVTGAAPAAVGQGGQRQPAAPRARTARQPSAIERGTGEVITS